MTKLIEAIIHVWYRGVLTFNHVAINHWNSDI